MQYIFEWDRIKATTNRKRHGVGFEEAATVFQDPRMLTLFDGAHSDHEDRWVTMGMSSLGRLLVVSHTFRETSADRSTIRLISSRKATRTESRAYRD